MLVEEIKEKQKDKERESRKLVKEKTIENDDDQNDFIDKNYWSIEDLEKSEKLSPQIIPKNAIH